ncbi:MAG: SUMF1/EgtB/PvdO family nonheme iron enzyme [Symploca sp. SIO3C6]|nr:SUMF1/EgtB/PvdO family nonheme iron enzyme [Symploca sp. SIO3C6]
MAKVALLVGVSEYQSGLQALPSAAQDVVAMQRILEHPEMGGFKEVKILTNPLTKELEIAIYDLFAERHSEDVILFYFSGHGVKDEHRNLYLTTPETRKSSKGIVVTPTAVTASYLQTQMSRSLCQRQVIILDCCYSGAIAKGLTAKDEGEIDIKAELGGKGRAILTSSTSVQSSFQQDQGLSIYTQYLVEGIETGAADRDGDGRISADELHQYASGKVLEASPAMTPQFYPVEGGYRIYLARAPQNDPKLEYRKAVEEVVSEDREDIDFIEGEIDFVNRCYLDELQTSLGLSPQETLAIEVEVMEPYRLRFEKLKRYEEVFKKAWQQRNSLSDREQRKLRRFQKALGLRDEDVSVIEAPIAPLSKLAPHTIAESVNPTVEAVTSSRAEAEEASETFEFETVTVDARGKVVKGDRKKQAKSFKEDLGNGVNLEMVSIIGGKFQMGTPDQEIERLVQTFGWDRFKRESPQHEVTVKPFFIGKYPITQKQWRAVASLPKVSKELKSDPSHFKGDDLPVEKVSWYDAEEFCQRLSKKTGRKYRLPSEAEWEYACRGLSTTPFHYGETLTDSLANYDARKTYASEPKGEYRKKTTPVGNFPPNGFGLYDMHGNVWEWCADDWHENYEGAPIDGSAWIIGTGSNSNKVLRGGSWLYLPSVCRCASRFNIIGRVEFDYDFGFRVVCVGARTM